MSECVCVFTLVVNSLIYTKGKECDNNVKPSRPSISLLPSHHYLMSLNSTETLAVPESYQPLALICFSLWSWITVLTISHWQRIDINAILHTISPLHKKKPLVVMATVLTILLACHIVLLEHAIFKQHTNVFNHFGPVVVCYAVTLALVLYFQDGQRFFKCLYRLMMKNCPVYFSDVLVADILISFSGVFTSIGVNLMRIANLPHSRYAPFITR